MSPLARRTEATLSTSTSAAASCVASTVMSTCSPAARPTRPVQLVTAAQSAWAGSAESTVLLMPGPAMSVTTQPGAAGPGPRFSTVMVHATGSPGFTGWVSSVLVIAKSGCGSATIGPIHERNSVMPLHDLVWLHESSSPTTISIDATFCAGSLKPIKRVDWLPQPVLSLLAVEPPHSESSGMASSGVIGVEAITAPVSSKSLTMASTPSSPALLGSRVSRSPTHKPKAPIGSENSRSAASS